jgi:CBS domain containing-hemolysin-like protein
LVYGRAPLELVNEALNSGFESEDFDTIGSLVLGQLGRPLELGDELVLDDYDLRVDEVDGPRVAQVVVREREEQDGAGEQHSE